MKEHIAPEVGDVWEHKNGVKFHIIRETTTCFNPWGEDTLYPAFEVIEEDGELNFLDEFGFTNDKYKYLGKSKVKLEELFDVAED